MIFSLWRTGTLLSARTESNQRCAKGCGSDERLRGAGVQSRLTPWTPIYAVWALAAPFSRTEYARRTLLPSKFVGICFYFAPPGACLPVECGGCRVSAATAQLPWFCQGRRCDFSALFHQILHRQGPVPPRQEEPAILILPAGRDYPRKQEDVPRSRGSGGNDCERPLREGAHRKQPPAGLWLLSDRSERNPPRRAEPSQ